jgi:hypothetical protein
VRTANGKMKSKDPYSWSLRGEVGVPRLALAAPARLEAALGMRRPGDHVLLLCHTHGTSGSLPYWCLIVNFYSYGATCRTPPTARKHLIIGVSHETSLCLLCGSGLRGGPLDLSATACFGHGSGYALPFLWPALRACNLGRAALRCVPFESRTPGHCPPDFVGTRGCPEVVRLTFVPALLFCFAS